MNYIEVNDIFDEVIDENKRLKQCLKVLVEYKSFIDLIVIKVKTNLGSNDSNKIEGLNNKVKQVFNSNEFNENDFKIEEKKENKTQNTRSSPHLNHKDLNEIKELNDNTVDYAFSCNALNTNIDEIEENEVNITQNTRSSPQKRNDLKTNNLKSDTKIVTLNTRKSSRNPRTDSIETFNENITDLKTNDNFVIKGRKADKVLRSDSLIKNKRFKCNTCWTEFTRKESLKIHITEVHTRSEPFKSYNKVIHSNNVAINVTRISQKHYICRFIGCDQQLTGIRKVYTHVERHTKSKPSKKEVNKEKLFKCNTCAKMFSSKNSLESHISAFHTGSEVPLKCTINDCNKVFNNELKLKRHITYLHSTKKRFRCGYPHCSERFNDYTLLMTHRETHSKPFVCDFEGCSMAYIRRDALENHKLKHSSERNFKCLYDGCDKCYCSDKDLKAHWNRVHSGIKYSCEWPGCDHTTSSKSSLKIHQLIHTNQRKYVCHWPQCGKAFITAPRLEFHIRIHKNEKRFKCIWPGCNYRCVESGNIGKHMRIHRK